MILKNMSSLRQSLVGVVAIGIVVAGCKSPNPEEPTGAPFKTVAYAPTAEAGIGITGPTPDPDRGLFKGLIAKRSPYFGKSRLDPFSLTQLEVAFDQQQEAERAFAQAGGFSLRAEIRDDVEQPPVFEPQPQRRLSGVVIGDSVLAILEGQDLPEPLIIRPGMRLPNSDWTVVSIDQEKAVLRRSGNVLPKEVTVRLEVAPPTLFGAPAGGGFPGGPGAPGGPPGGFGGPPGGFGGPGGGRAGADGGA